MEESRRSAQLAPLGPLQQHSSSRRESERRRTRMRVRIELKLKQRNQKHQSRISELTSSIVALTAILSLLHLIINSINCLPDRAHLNADSSDLITSSNGIEQQMRRTMIDSKNRSESSGPHYDGSSFKNTSDNKKETRILGEEGENNLINNNNLTTMLNESQNFLANEQLKLPLYMRIVATFACLVIFIVGVTGNLLVPLVVIKTKYLRNSTNLFLINLSMADLLVLLVCMPIVFIELHSRPETWLLGESMCK